MERPQWGDGFSGWDCGLRVGGRGFLFEEEAMAEVDSGRPWQGRGGFMCEEGPMAEVNPVGRAMVRGGFSAWVDSGKRRL